MVIVDDTFLGLDGFSFEFFKATWDCVGHDLPRVYKEVHWKNPLRVFFNKCFIKFILYVGKEGERKIGYKLVANYSS
jgi:hypothetical protein